MKNGTGQLVLTLLLMLALFLQIEGVVPDIFASSEEPLVMVNEKEGLGFKITIDDKGFSVKDKVVIKTTITNIGAVPIGYYADTAAYGIRGALGAVLYSSDGNSKFTDELAAQTTDKSSRFTALDGELPSGGTISSEFNMLPYFIDNEDQHIAAPGKYILKLWYNRGNGETIETEFQVTLVKRFGKMHLKGQA